MCEALKQVVYIRRLELSQNASSSEWSGVESVQPDREEKCLNNSPVS